MINTESNLVQWTTLPVKPIRSQLVTESRMGEVAYHTILPWPRSWSLLFRTFQHIVVRLFARSQALSSTQPLMS